MGEIIDIRELMGKREADQMTRLEFEARLEYLEEYQAAVSEKRCAEMKLEENEMDYGPSARPLTGMPGGKKTDGSDRIIRKMEEHDLYEREYEHWRKEAFERMKELKEVIDKLPPKQRKVLLYRYINDMDIEQVAAETNYSTRQVIRIHKQGVMQIKPPRYKLNKIKKRLQEEHPEWLFFEVKPA